MKGKYKNNIYYMIVSIIICGVIIVILNYMVLTARQYLVEYNKFSQDKVEETHAKLSKNLSYMNNTVMSIKMSDEVKSWSKCIDWVDMHFKSILVQKRIKQETIYDNDLKFKVAITFLDDRELVVTSDMTSQKHLFFKTLGIEENEVDEIYQQMKDSPYEAQIIKRTNNLEEDYIHHFTKFSYNENQLMYIISIKEEDLLEMITEENGDYFIFDKNQILFEDPNRFYTEEEVTQKILSLNPETNQTIGEKDTYNYINTKIIVKSIPEMGWMLAYIYAPRLVEGNKLMVSIGLIFGIAIVLAILISKLMTNRLYRPVQNLLEDISDEESEQKEEIDNEFEYISLYNKKMVATNHQLIKEKFYKELLNGIKDYTKSEEVNHLENKSFRVVLVEFDDFNQRLEDEQTFCVKQSIRNEVIQIAAMEYVNIDYKTCGIVIMGEMEIKEIRKSILQIIKNVEGIDNLKIKLAVGLLVQGASNLYCSFEQAKKIMEYKNAFPNKLILTEADVNKLDFKVSTFPIRVENKLISHTVHGDDEALVILEKMIEDNLKDNKYSIYQCKNFVLAILVTLNRVFDQMSVAPQTYLEEVYQDYLDLYEGYNENISVKLKNIFGFIIKKVKNQEVQTKQDMSEQMLEYIYTHYPEDIMLEDMAATLNISVKYCSVLFKRVTGENFKTVLNEYRIQKAKELLEDKNIKVSEVATLVGFNSPNTFIRVFNKYVGISPGIYQEQNVKGA